LDRTDGRTADAPDIARRGAGVPRLVFPGCRDIRGYRAMYRDFHRAILTGATPEMSLERAMDDQRVMDQIYASLAPAGPVAVAR
jgi:predicted dehydrogenase